MAATDRIVMTPCSVLSKRTFWPMRRFELFTSSAGMRTAVDFPQLDTVTSTGWSSVFMIVEIVKIVEIVEIVTISAIV